MLYSKKIVCLANSYKDRGHCVAGREVQPAGAFGGWLRPVSERPGAELSSVECRYCDRSDPELMDILEIQLAKLAPDKHQTENHAIYAGPPWEKRGELRWSELEKLREYPESLWSNGGHSAQGHNDCMSEAEASKFGHSLVLIRMTEFVVEVKSRLWDGVPTRSYRGRFDYRGTHYNMSVTDPVARTLLQNQPERDYLLEDVYLCVSLTEPYRDAKCYKLVAGIIGDPPLRA